LFQSLRVRIVLRYALLMALATAASIVAARQVIVAQVNDRIDHALAQERQELARLASEGVDPATGEPLGGRVRRIFEVFLERNVPSRGEAFLTFVGGRPYLRSAQVVPYRLDTDPDLAGRWSSLRETARGRVDTPGGEIEYLAVPLRAQGETRGVFVVAIFRSFETDDIDDLTRVLGGVGIVIFVIGTLLAWRSAQRIVQPVQAVTRTARQISGGDLTRRIPVSGDAEVAELAGTFNEMLDRLESAFGTQRRFLDDAGHELRTPITIVRGHLELLGDDPAEREETMALVMDELDRMSRLVDDVLLLAKVERPDFLSLETVEVGALTREIHAKASALAPRDWVEPAVGHGVIVADRQRLTQAVIQLAQNAVQHTGDGQAIAISSWVDGGAAGFSVRDHGPGVPPAERERIFDRFARGSGVPREGAGLGLAIVRAIAEAHGGRVALESPPGGGAMFVIEVPVDPPASGPPVGVSEEEE
jgi:signal transduction histidine kinase